MLDQRYELRHLNDALALEIRPLMLAELLWSLEHQKLYYSKQFAAHVHDEYPRILMDALTSGTPDTLDEALNQPGIFRPNTPRRSAQSFIWDEFNKFYMRALCLWVIMHPGHEVVVVRGRVSEHHRGSSDAQLGRKEDPKKFLEVLRETPEINPFGANSGLTLTIRKKSKAKSTATAPAAKPLQETSYH
jgi:hypothetical protein